MPQENLPKGLAPTIAVIADQVQGTATDPFPGVHYNGGLKSNANGELYITTAIPVGSGDVQLAPFKVARDGAMYVTTDAPVYFVAGLGFNQNGALCVTADARTGYLSGWPMRGVYVCMGGVGPPPPAASISQIVLTMPTADTGVKDYFSQLLYGASSVAVDTPYTDKAVFGSDNPGLNLEDFDGIAGAGSTAPMPAFTDFTISVAPGSLLVADSANPVGGSTYDAFTSDNSPGTAHVITIDFTPPVEAAGLNYAYGGGKSQSVTAQFYDGATLLHTFGPSLPASPLTNPVWSFVGFARESGSAPPPETFNRTTSEGDTRTTADGDNRIWV